MKGMKLGEFMDKIYIGDEIEFKIGDITYFVQGNYCKNTFSLTVDYWSITDGTEPQHDYLFSIECDSAEERTHKFEEAKIFAGHTIYEAEQEIEVLYG